MTSNRHSRKSLALIAVCALCACTINPATGQRQLTLIGEQQEIAMGQNYDRQIVAQLGLYPDEEWQNYIDGIGQRMAALSERPNLPWVFRVVDDPTVNAFAVPGGNVYITRGILAHCDSEAQLASVIGHEIGHVTARHSVEQLSRTQLAQLGLGVAVIASEDFREYAGLAQLGLQVLFLKFGRDDERQSDDLGLRYLVNAGYDPNEMPKMFEMLSRQSNLHGGQRIPVWQSTHPDPVRRSERIRQAIMELPPDARRGTIERSAFLNRLDNMIFGDDPRQGYTVGSAFMQPEMEFRVDFPQGWTIINQRHMVAAVSPQKDSVLALTLAEEPTPKAAAQAFFQQQGIDRGTPWRRDFFRFSTTPQTDSTGQSSASIRGLVGFIAHQGQVFRLISYAEPEIWKLNSQKVQRSLGSFRKLTTRRFLDVTPARIKIVHLRSAMTLAEFQQRMPSTVDLETLAVLNGVERTHRFSSGDLVKRVVGGRLPKK